MEEYIDHFFNVHEFSPTHDADNCNGEHEETWSFCTYVWKCRNSISKMTTPVHLVDHHLSLQKIT